MWLIKIIGQIKVTRQYNFMDAKVMGLRKCHYLESRCNIDNKVRTTVN